MFFALLKNTAKQDPFRRRLCDEVEPLLGILQDLVKTCSELWSYRYQQTCSCYCRGL